MSASWSVAVLSSRESVEALSQTLRCAFAAAPRQATIFDLVINGNPALAASMSRLDIVLTPPNPWHVVRVWSIEKGDKANAWNEYLRHIRPLSEVTFFLDGYTQLQPDCMQRAAQHLQHLPQVLAVSGVPGVGRSRKAYGIESVAKGFLHGNFIAVRAETMSKLCDRNFRLPLGTYYHDGILTTVMQFGLDMSTITGDSTRVYVDPEIQWAVPVRSAWNWRDLRNHWKRMRNQAHGKLEHKATSWAFQIHRYPLDGFPETMNQWIREWLQACPDAARALFRKHPLCYLAAKRVLSTTPQVQPPPAPMLMTPKSLQPA
ncbi:MAG: hypothetical protein ACRC8S_10940 [Fimbriiglobus sp.]